MNYTDALRYLAQSLQEIYSKGESQTIARWVLEHVTGRNETQSHINQKNDLEEKEIAFLKICREELLKHKPVQYVLNESYFFGMKFYVDENVLIPRPETEELVEWVIKFCTATHLSSPNILDIGTGSGCIALALKKNIRSTNISAIDISSDALNVAKKNADIHHLRINFFQSSILEKLDTAISGFDILVSNPPYITVDEAKNMEKNVLAYEPHQALFVRDNNPLLFYTAIEERAAEILKPNGHIFLELNAQFAMDTQEMFRKKNWNAILKKDMSGNYRMLHCYR